MSQFKEKYYKNIGGFIVEQKPCELFKSEVCEALPNFIYLFIFFSFNEATSFIAVTSVQSSNCNTQR